VSAGVAHGAGAQAGALARHAPVLLVWSCLLLLPFGRAVEVPVLLMAAAGIGLVVRERTRLLASPATRTFVFVFAAMWLPMALSLPDAVHPQRTALVVANHLRFLLGGLFICHALAAPGARERLLALAGALLALWVLDGGVQWLLGVDLLGQASAGGRISGPFGDDSRKLGTTFAVLAPLLWVCAQRRFPAWVLVVAVLASAWLVMGAGSRAAWVTLLVAAAGFAWASRARLRSLGTRVVLAAVLSVATILEAGQGREFTQWYVYGSTWFIALLALLGVNILAAALIRWPWKKQQTGFVVTHAGLLVLLAGAVQTFMFGSEGQVILQEGQRSDQMLLTGRSVITAIRHSSDGRRSSKFSFRPGPSDWASSAALDFGLVDGFGLKVLRFLRHAEEKTQWVAADYDYDGAALHLALSGPGGSLMKDQWLTANRDRSDHVCAVADLSQIAGRGFS